ncbi:hypothetical protein [Caudoviricetes sp.]|nr:hypothetical protein [Caudoviricetes sp.]
MSEMVEVYQKLTAGIAELDEVLDAQTADAKTAGKRKLTNDLIEAETAAWEPIVDQLDKILAGIPVERQIGVYFGLVRALGSSYSNKLAAEVEALVNSQPTIEVEKLSPEKIKEMSSVRSDLARQLSTLIQTLTNFGMNILPDGTEMVPAKKRTGGRGPRGKRALSYFTWWIDDVEFENLKAVVEAYDSFEKVANLTKAFREAGIDTQKPGDRIDFTLPDGKILVGVKGEDAPETDSDADDDDDDSVETETVETEEVE